MDTIYEHNKGNHTWTMGINQFSDLTPTEFERIYLGYIHRPNAQRNEADLSGLPTADEIDWTTKGAVTPIKDQAQCGSCWAFSTTGSLEGAHFVHSGELVSLSEQQFVDCDTKEDQGCNGGLMDSAFKFAETTKIMTEADYPYKAKRTIFGKKCNEAASKGVVSVSKYAD